jgi:acyl-CoA dehydrogenase
MSGTNDLLLDSAERLFTTHATKEVVKAAGTGVWPRALWRAVEEAGFCAAMLPEEAGGFGASVTDAVDLVRVAAFHTAPIPLPETMLGGWLLAHAGLVVPPGPLTVAPVRRADSLGLTRQAQGWHLTGTASRIPWARDCTAIVVVAESEAGPMVACLAAGGFGLTQAENLAGEPRDTITVDAVLAPDQVAASPDGMDVPALRCAGAAMRTAQIAGALARALSLSVQYAQTRVQFGRPIGKFQAIQQNLAVLAGQSAAALAAAGIAADALAHGLSPVTIGAAKLRAGEAASIAAGLAHQAHGAIGFTQEYELHYATRRLWSWRDEFGNEAEWGLIVGRAAVAAGADGLWPAITAA